MQIQPHQSSCGCEGRKDCANPIPGIHVHTNPRNGFRVVEVHYTADANKAKPEWIRQAKKGLGKHFWNREYEIDWESIGGLPCYPEWSVEFDGNDAAEGGNICRPFAIPRNWNRYRVIDPGFRNPFACLWYAVSPRGYSGLLGSPRWTWGKPWPTVFQYLEHYKAGERTPYHKRRIHQLTGGDNIEFTVVDPEARVDKGLALATRTGMNSKSMYQRKTYQQELHNSPFAIPTVPFMRMRSEFAEIDIVATAIKRRQYVVFQTCPNTIREHGRWVFKEAPEGRNPYESPVDKDNHTCDCTKYFFNSPWEGSPGLDVTPVVPATTARLQRWWGNVHRVHREVAQADADFRDEMAGHDEEGPSPFDDVPMGGGI